MATMESNDLCITSRPWLEKSVSCWGPGHALWSAEAFRFIPFYICVSVWPSPNKIKSAPCHLKVPLARSKVEAFVGFSVLCGQEFLKLYCHFNFVGQHSLHGSCILSLLAFSTLPPSSPCLLGLYSRCLLGLHLFPTLLSITIDVSCHVCKTLQRSSLLTDLCAVAMLQQ